MSFPLIPLFDRIIIKRSEKEEVSKGGIILAHNKDEAGPAKGVIVAVGPGRRDDRGDIQRPPVKIGQIAYFSPHADMRFEIDGEEYQAMNAEDIIGVESAVVVELEKKKPLGVADRYRCADCRMTVFDHPHDCPAKPERAV